LPYQHPYPEPPSHVNKSELSYVYLEEIGCNPRRKDEKQLFYVNISIP